MKAKTAKQTSSILVTIIFDVVLFSVWGYLVYWFYINKFSLESTSLYLLIFLALPAFAIALLIRYYQRKGKRQTQ